MVIFLFDPEYHRNDARDRGIRAAEEYELRRALREADERVRTERKTTRSGHRYLGLIVRHTRLTAHSSATSNRLVNIPAGHGRRPEGFLRR